MPAGNLTVIDNTSGLVIATGCRTIKQAEAAIFSCLTDLAQETDDETISNSFSVLSPYKKFGDAGVQGYAVPKADLVTEPTEKPDVVIGETTEDNLVGDLDIV